MLLGAIYAVGARYIRDLTVRTMQRESYVTAVRVFGIGMSLAGAGVLVALGLDLL